MSRLLILSEAFFLHFADVASLMKWPVHDSHTDSTIILLTITLNHFCHTFYLPRDRRVKHSVT